MLRFILFSLVFISLACIFIPADRFAYALGFTWNITDSVPPGIYRLTTEKPKKGDYVSFCPPNEEPFIEARKRGYLRVMGVCPGNFGYMLKKVAALPSDEVSMTAEGVTVNGQKIPYSKPLTEDAFHRRLEGQTIKNQKLKPGEILFMGENNIASWDGRYFGILKSSQVISVVKPFWLFGEKKHAK